MLLKSFVFQLLLIPFATKVVLGAQPVILDTDYGPFIDDVFALGLIVNSGDLLDLQYVVISGEYPDMGAQCASMHLDIANRQDIPVGIGPAYKDFSERGGVCAIENLLGFTLQETCGNANYTVDQDGVAAMAKLLEESDHDDWWYIVLGGQTTIQKLVQDYPAAASKISTLVVMGGNWCADFEPFPGVMAPTSETNIACDPGAANMMLDRNVAPFQKIYYVPVVVADEIKGEDYIKIVEAATEERDLGAKATINFYNAWTASGRNDTSVLIHLEAMTYDPETESVPQYDACAIMLALELLDDDSCENRLSLVDFEGVHFVESGDQDAPAGALSAFSLVPEGNAVTDLPELCPSLTSYTFDPDATPESEIPVTVALGFTSQAAKDSFYAEMAERMAGTFGGTSGGPACFSNSEELSNDSDDSGTHAATYLVGVWTMLLVTILWQ